MSVTSVLHALRKDLRRFAADVVSWFIPVHMKRIVYLITLYHYMLNDPSNEKIDDLCELNSTLDLAKTDAKSLVLPGFLTASIWRGNGRDLLELPESELKRIVLARSPCWLRYGRNEDLENDLVTLRRFILQHN